MARSGSFGTSLNPFGTGTLGNLGQYSIGDNLKDLEAYRLEIAWGNGQITDTEYQASLTKLAAAADPGTTAQLSAQNKLVDVTYRIGRSEADAQGLDALIAFDQQALSGMDSGNLRYRDVKSTLDSEMAQRRSRDYGLIVDDYNAGKTSTESLLAWVQNTLASLPGDAPDKDNWDSVKADLSDRLVSEKDAQVYQDYQDRKMAPADFLAYLTGRRDAYDPSSPKYAEADRRLEDAQKNVKDAAQAKIDQDVANRYNDGKISDHTYLVWLGKRVANLAPDDPSRPEWEHRLTQAAHSLAEDKLRTDVSLAKTQTGQDTAKKALRDFYKAYAVTLNPGSAEYRSTMVSINSLTPAPTAKVSGGGGGTATGGGGTATAGTLKLLPKVISPTSNIDTLLGSITPNASAPKKNQAAAVVYLRLNLGHATDALAAGDKEWVFVNPAYPGQTVTEHNPNGSIYHDKNRKTVQIPGSAYLPTTSQAVSDMQNATAVYSYALAGIALAKGDSKGYATALDHASNAETAARNTQAHAVQRDLTPKLKALQQGAEHLTALNDPAGALSLLMTESRAIGDALKNNPTLSDEMRNTLQTKKDAIDSDPLMPSFVEDPNNPDLALRGADGQPMQIGGAVDFANTARDPSTGLPIPGAGVYRPGYHFMLDTNSKGEAKWGSAWTDPRLQSTWEKNLDGTPNHVQVQTGKDGQVVTGWVKVSPAAIWPNISFVDQDGKSRTIPYTGGAQSFAYTDANGNRVIGYSIDSGATWVQATGGVLPVLQFNVPVTWDDSKGDGSVTVTDAAGNILFHRGATTAMGTDATWKNNITPAAKQGEIGWWGQAAAENGTPGTTGAPFQYFRIVNANVGENGQPSLNFIPNDVLYAISGRANRPTAVKTAAEGRAPGFAPPTPPSGYAATLTPKTAAEGRAPGFPRVPDLVPKTAAEGRAPSYAANKAFDAGAFASSLVSAVAPKVQGIISVGAALMPVIAPPASLPPAYNPVTLFPVSNLTPLTAPKVPTIQTLLPTLTAPVKTAVTTAMSTHATDVAAAAAANKKAAVPQAPTPTVKGLTKGKVQGV